MSYVFQFFNNNSQEWIGPDECHYDNEVELLAISVFGLCGCSDKHTSLSVIRDTLRHFNESSEKGTYWPDLVRDVFNGIEGAAYLVCSLLDGKFIEHGTAIRGSWLTQHGIALLEDLNKIISDLEASEASQK